MQMSFNPVSSVQPYTVASVAVYTRTNLPQTKTLASEWK